MEGGYPIYKGLQKPLVYRGFKGKFIYWGVASLVLGLVFGGGIGAMTNMYFGGFLTILAISGGLGYTFHRQGRGLHSKTLKRGVLIHPANIKISYGKRK